MTIDRMVELLKIEHECMLRKSHGDCDGQCEDCELVQDDGELHEMYENVIGLVEKMEAVEPVEPDIEIENEIEWCYICGECGTPVDEDDERCIMCWRPIKWN